jgi:hypothetical protein
MTGILELNSRAARLLQTLPRSAFVFRLDRKGVFLEVVNFPDPKRLWLPPNEYIGKILEEVLPLEMAIDRRHFFDRAVATRQQQTYSYPHPITKGRYMACTLFPLEGTEGEVQEVVMQVQDVAPITPIGDLYVLHNP